VTIKAIPTIYNGIKFRSRLEARIAATLDAINIGWDYETEAYQIGDIRYLPDMIVGGAFVEIKPSQGNDTKIAALATATDTPCYLMHPVNVTHIGSFKGRDVIGVTRVRGEGFYASAVLASCSRCGAGQPWTIGATRCATCGRESDVEKWWDSHYQGFRGCRPWPLLPQYQDGHMIWQDTAMKRAARSAGIR